jgi:hypothetical protein
VDMRRLGPTPLQEMANSVWSWTTPLAKTKPILLSPQNLSQVPEPLWNLGCYPVCSTEWGLVHQ